jgi:hypothetical protein
MKFTIVIYKKWFTIAQFYEGAVKYIFNDFFVFSKDCKTLQVISSTGGRDAQAKPINETVLYKDGVGFQSSDLLPTLRFK